MPKTHLHITRLLFLVTYGALLAASSLYPFSGWQIKPDADFAFLWAAWPKTVTRIDLLTNIFVYAPFGMLAMRGLYHHRYTPAHWLMICLLGAAFSTSMECLQLLVPHRVSSNTDILSNTLGVALGAGMTPFLSRHNRWFSYFILLRRHWFRAGWVVDLGLILLLLWLLAQFSLQIPSLVAGSLHDGFTPFWESRVAPFRPKITLLFALEIASLSLFMSGLLRPEQRRATAILGFALGAILLKLLVAALLIKLSFVLRLLSLEAVLGLFLGTGLLLGVCLFRPTPSPFPQIALILSIFVLAKFLFGVPFLTATGQTPNLATQPELLFNLGGIAYLAAEIWPLLALGCCLALWGQEK